MPKAAAHQDPNAGVHHAGPVALALGALGIVYGDIGTSPLYAFREAFEHTDLKVDTIHAYGAASLAFWALVVIISIKYLTLVMRADNHGEGGILALTALLMPTSGLLQGRKRLVIALGVFGTALLYGDGLITPAISVLSAVEGFEVATSAFERWVIPVSIAILVMLFLFQRRGTHKISKVFGPVMIVWFVTIAALGVRQIIGHPAVLKAVSPTYAVQFFGHEPGKAFLALGSIFLVVTGGESLYADMGHFGRRPIALSWYTIVMPALMLNYFGQAALLAAHPGQEVGSPFFRLAPEWAVTPVAILATMASVIASQALISGAFSLTAQAVQLDYLPRVDIRHTSHGHKGQIYVPLINWLLMLGCVGLVLGFRSSGNLAAAYGTAMTTTMTITTMLFYRVVIDRWGWSRGKALAVVAPLLFVDLAFLTANLPKIPHGGWFPLLLGFGLVVQMTTWRRGRAIVAQLLQRGQRPLDQFVGELIEGGVARVPGTAVYMFKDPNKAPPAMVSNLAHNHVLHETTIVLSVQTADAPVVPTEERTTVEEVGPGVYQVVVTFGFTDQSNVVTELRQVELSPGVRLDLDQATFFIGRETVTSTPHKSMSKWREELFILLNRGAASASRFYGLPSKQVFEVGTQVDI